MTNIEVYQIAACISFNFSLTLNNTRLCRNKLNNPWKKPASLTGEIHFLQEFHTSIHWLKIDWLVSIWWAEAVRRCSVKKTFLNISPNSSGACYFIKKETPAGRFSCEFCKIFQNAFFYRTPPVAAAGWVAEDQQELKATRCSNRDDLLHLSFTLKISIFSEACI